MDDAGVCLPDRAGSAAVERLRLLRQIADAIGLPVSALTPGHDVTSGERQSPSDTECAAALAAFSRIMDPHLRAYCLQMMDELSAH